MMAVLMPTTRPRESTSGPPEFPGFNGAVCWMTLSMRRPSRERSDRAERLDDAGGHAGVEAERIADGDDELAGAQIFGFAERADGEIAGGQAARGRWLDRRR